MTIALTLQSNWHLMNAQTLAHVSEYAGLSKRIEKQNENIKHPKFNLKNVEILSLKYWKDLNFTVWGAKG